MRRFKHKMLLPENSLRNLVHPGTNIYLFVTPEVYQQLRQQEGGNKYRIKPLSPIRNANSDDG